jgi:hypothetical protein
VLRRRHDVIALPLWDPREAEMPAAGLVAFLDPETGERRVLDTSDAAVRAKLRPLALARASSIFKRTGVDAVPLSTAEPYDRPLAGFFRARERRR